MAVPIRDLVAQIRLRINSKDVKKVISDARNLKKKLSKELSPKRTQFKLSIDPKNLKAIRDSLLSVKKQIRNSLNPINFKESSEALTRNKKKVDRLTRSFRFLRKSIKKALEIKKDQGLFVLFKKLSFKTLAASAAGFLAMATAITAAGVALGSFLLIKGVNSLKNFGIEAAKTGRTIQTLSVVTGISEDSIERFAFLSKGIGISAEQSRSALSSFTRQIAEARNGSDKAAIAFSILSQKAKIPIPLFDGAGKRSTDDIFKDTIKALSQITDESERVRLAGDLFSESIGTALVPVLSGAEGSMEEAGKRMAELGGGFSQLTRDEGNDLLRSMRDIDFVFDGLKDTVLRETLPALNEFLKTMLELCKANKEVIGQNTKDAFKAITEFLVGDPSEKAKEFFDFIKDK
jgi:hypothetical protein